MADISMLLPHQVETKIYFSGRYVVIEQEDDGDPEHRPHLISIAIENVEQLRLRLEELEKQAKSAPKSAPE